MIDWLVLTGGSSSRLGADKSTTVLAGRTLTERAVQSIGEVDARGTVRIVGPDRTGGPAAAVVSMLPELAGPFVGVLAVDMPFADGALDAVVARVRHHLADDSTDAWVPVDSVDRRQWLCAVYRLAALRGSAARRDDWQGASFHSLVGHFTTTPVAVDVPDSLLDIDTPEDLRQAQAIVENPGGGKGKDYGHGHG